MHITDIHITPIAVGDPPLLNAAGLHAPYALRTIVEIVTNDGIYGLGEVPGSAATTASLEATREVLIGKDPFQLNQIYADLADRFGVTAGKTNFSQAYNLASGEKRGDSPWDRRRLVHVYSAIEVACFDIMGKVTGRPVCDLLGGRVRDRVPFSAYLFFKYEGAGGELGFATDPNATGWAAARQAAALDPEGIVKQAQAMCKEFGFQSIKLKGGALPPDVEVASILAMHDAFGPTMPLRLDPNAIWTVETFGRRQADAQAP